ncbi:MAG TPA: nucleotidyltransferase domain-containing protein [Hyphomicrobiaceae bacterium]|nr:nucleotidyltransferase domain-containing protein [Hyphomicrobiaceae bacterium]
MTSAVETVSDGSTALTREHVLSLLREHEAAVHRYGVKSLHLYGSAARDELTPRSDVDLFVDCDDVNAFGFVELLDLRGFLRDLLGRNVDLTSRAGLHRLLRAKIEQSSPQVF